MKRELNIAAILKDKPKGTKLYSVTFGDCTFDGVTGNDNISLLYLQDSPFFTDKYGKYDEKGECLIFPSRNMRDWSKLTWKKGDVLKSIVGNNCIFDCWSNEDYTEFYAEFLTTKGNERYAKHVPRYTIQWYKEDNRQYIHEIEKHYGGKLNLSTLEIEKPQFKDGDIVAIVSLKKYVCIAIYQMRQEQYIGFHAVLCNNGKLLLEEPFREDDGDIEIRLATDSEKQQLFSALEKDGKAWDADKKTIVDLPKKCEFKPMDWCLMRMHRCIWRLCQYSSDYNGKDSSCRYIAVGGNAYEECIPYNDQTAHLLGTTDDWKGGEG